MYQFRRHWGSLDARHISVSESKLRAFGSLQKSSYTKIQSSAQFTYLTVFNLCKIVLLWIYSVTGLQKCRAPQFLRGISRLVHAEMVAQYSWYCWRNTFVHPGIYFASMISKHGCCVDWGPHIMDMSRVAQKQHTPWLDEWYSWGGGDREGKRDSTKCLRWMARSRMMMTSWEATPPPPPLPLTC